MGRFKSGGIDYSPVWKFVGNHPMNLDWNPGYVASLCSFYLSSILSHICGASYRYYTRQAALVRAINPSAEIPLPIFSLEEVALLSRKSDPARLPDLRKAVGAGKGVRYPVEERLGLEKVGPDFFFLYDMAGLLTTSFLQCYRFIEISNMLVRSF